MTETFYMILNHNNGWEWWDGDRWTSHFHIAAKYESRSDAVTVCQEQAIECPAIMAVTIES